MAGRDGQQVRIGEIVGVFGIKGAVKVRSLTDFPSRFAVGSVLMTPTGPRKVLSAHWHKDQVRIQFDNVDSVEAAQELVGGFVTVGGDERPKFAKDEYLARDLVGLDVLEDGKLIGAVKDVVKSPAHDLLVVEGVFIPLIHEFVKRVDLDNKRIEVRLIDGMRPGESAEEVR